MGLIREIKNANGSTANYSRISNILKESNKIVITLKCYLDESYRNIEKEIESIASSADELMLRNAYLSSLYNADQLTNEDEIKEYEEINNKLAKLNDNSKYYLHETTVTLDYIPDTEITFESLYKQLEELEEI